MIRILDIVLDVFAFFVDFIWSNYQALNTNLKNRSEEKHSYYEHRNSSELKIFLLMNVSYQGNRSDYS